MPRVPSTFQRRDRIEITIAFGLAIAAPFGLHVAGADLAELDRLAGRVLPYAAAAIVSGGMLAAAAACAAIAAGYAARYSETVHQFLCRITAGYDDQPTRGETNGASRQSQDYRDHQRWARRAA